MRETPIRVIWPFAVGALALLAGCGKTAVSEEETTAPTPVTVETAVRGAIDRLVTADAVLYPINQSNVTSKIDQTRPP